MNEIRPAVRAATTPTPSFMTMRDTSMTGLQLAPTAAGREFYHFGPEPCHFNHARPSGLPAAGDPSSAPQAPGPAGNFSALSTCHNPAHFPTAPKTHHGP